MTGIVMGTLAIGALLVSASPASGGTTADPSGHTSAPVVEEKVPVSTSGLGTADYRYTCFGYTGTFRDGSQVEGVDWDGDGEDDECFGVAPDRTIWHAWPGSGGWREMPNNGRADDFGSGFYRDGRRTVSVLVLSENRAWCSYYTSSWSRWYACGWS